MKHSPELEEEKFAITAYFCTEAYKRTKVFWIITGILWIILVSAQ
jgi:hypothetical protein